MSVEVVSQKRLAEELGVTSRQIRNLEETGVILPVSRGRYALAACRTRYGLFKSRDPERVAELADEAGDDLAAVRRGLKRLDPEVPDWPELRRLGPKLEAADGSLRLLCALRPDAERAVAGEMRKQVVAGALAELLELASEWRAYERRPASGPAGSVDQEANDAR